MPRRGRSASPSRASPMASRPAATQPVPVSQPPSAIAQPMPSQGPGLFAQMAATAGGVAVGSAVGHAVGHAITGAFSGGSSHEVSTASPAPVASQQAVAPIQNQPKESPCALELRQFLNCTQEQSDISLCEGFNQVLKDCRTRYGPSNAVSL